MKIVTSFLTIITAALMLSGCATSDKSGSQVTRTHEENTSRVIESEPVIGQPASRR